MINTVSALSNLKMVRMDNDVHERLASIGKYGESLSDIIKRVLDFYDKHQQEPDVSKTRVRDSSASPKDKEEEKGSRK